MPYSKHDKRLIHIIAEKVADNRVPELTGIQIIMDNWNQKKSLTKTGSDATSAGPYLV